MGIPTTGQVQPWKKGQIIEADRLNEWLSRCIFDIKIQNGTPLTTWRVGNQIVIGMKQDGRPKGPSSPVTDTVGQYLGTVHTVVAANTSGWDYNKLVSLP